MAEENKKQISLEQAKLWRFILRIVFIIVSVVLPLVIIGTKFKLFSQATTTKWSITAIVLVLIVAWRFKKKLGEWINKWENSNIFKWILLGIGKVWPFLLIVSILAALQYSSKKITDAAAKMLTDTLFVLEWMSVCELVSYLIIYPIEMKFDYLVQRMIRKNERKADFKEAMKEMREEQ